MSYVLLRLETDVGNQSCWSIRQDLNFQIHARLDPGVRFSGAISEGTFESEV